MTSRPRRLPRPSHRHPHCARRWDVQGFRALRRSGSPPPPECDGTWQRWEVSMADVTVKRIEDMESIWGGSFVRARASLAASSFGMNIWNSPPNWESWEHNHADPPVSD